MIGLYIELNFESVFYTTLIVLAVLSILGSILLPKKVRRFTPRKRHSPHPIIKMIEGYNPDKFIEDK